VVSAPLRSVPARRRRRAFPRGGAAAGGGLFSPGVTAAGVFCAARRRRLSPGGALPARGPRRAAGHRFPVAHDLGFKILFYEGCSVGSPSADSVLSRIRPAAPPGSSPWRMAAMAGIDTTHPKTSITF